MNFEIAGYVAIFFMGITLGMFGSGGSIFTIPILVYLFKLEPLIAITHSLVIVGTTAFIGGLRYMSQKLVHFKAVFYFAVPGLGGIYAARLLVLPLLPDPIFSIYSFALPKAVFVMLIFSALMLCASIALFKRRLLRADEVRTLPPFLTFIGQGAMVGFATGFVGVGGGFIIVPMLIHLLDLPLRVAAGTSLFIIAINALFGFSLSYMNGAQIQLDFIGTILGVSIAGLMVGIFISKIILEDTLKIVFALLVLLIGIFVFFDQLRLLFI